jgi:hypothetical protein
VASPSIPTGISLVSEESKGVYITSSNLTKLKDFYQEAVCITDDVVKDELYQKDLSWILSVPQMKTLFIEKLILSNDNRIVVREKSVATRYNSKMIFASNAAPKYHFDCECKFMKSNYINFFVPVEIEVRGEEAVRAFMGFAEENKSVFYEDQQKFLDMIEVRFLLGNPLTKVNYPNSGIEDFITLDIDQMEDAIHQHLEKAEYFKDQSPEISREIKRLNYAPIKVVSQDGISDLVKEWHFFYKVELRKMLRAYIIKSSNSDLSFNEMFLRGLGFEECKACIRKSP